MKSDLCKLNEDVFERCIDELAREIEGKMIHFFRMPEATPFANSQWISDNKPIVRCTYGRYLNTFNQSLMGIKLSIIYITKGE
jgi:hypothetical protein